jgi:hypothetical protein
MKKAAYALDEAAKYPEATSKVERLRRTFAQIKAILENTANEQAK